MWDSFHIYIVLVVKEIHLFWGSYCKPPLCWQWHLTLLIPISPLVYSKVIKGKTKPHLSFKNPMSQAPVIWHYCCSSFTQPPTHQLLLSKITNYFHWKYCAGVHLYKTDWISIVFVQNMGYLPMSAWRAGGPFYLYVHATPWPSFQNLF